LGLTRKHNRGGKWRETGKEEKRAVQEEATSVQEMRGGVEGLFEITWEKDPRKAHRKKKENIGGEGIMQNHRKTQHANMEAGMVIGDLKRGRLLQGGREGTLMRGWKAY